MPSSSTATIPIMIPKTPVVSKTPSVPVRHRNSLNNTPDMIPDGERHFVPDIQLDAGMTDEDDRRKQSRENSEYAALALEAFQQELRLDDDSVLQDKVEIREVSSGTFLMKEESHKVSIKINL